MCQCGNLMFRIVRIFVLPSSIHLIADAGHRFGSVNSLKCLLDKFSTFLIILKGVSPIKLIRLTLMNIWGVSPMELEDGLEMSLTLCYGALQVLDLLLDLGLDCLALPLGCLMVLLPWGGPLLSHGPFCFDLQHVLKWFLFPCLWHFLPHAGHSLGGWGMCCICCMSYLGHPWLCGHCLSWTWMSQFHLWLLLLQFHHWICVSWSYFTVISCSLTCWRRA